MDVRIKVCDSARIGVLNLGTIIGNIESNLDAIDTALKESADVREGLRALAEVAINDAEIDDSQRRELLEGVDFLAKAATQPETPTPRGVLRAVVGLLGQLAQASDSLHAIWVQWGHPLASFFGVG